MFVDKMNAECNFFVPQKKLGTPDRRLRPDKNTWLVEVFKSIGFSV